MGLFSENIILHRVFVIPAPNVDWYKFEIYANISNWDGKVKKLYSEIINRNGLKRRIEINNACLTRLSEQTQLLHYLFRWGISEKELKTIQSQDFIDSQIINNKICVSDCLKLTRYDLLPDEYRLIRLYLALRLWEAYYDDCRIDGVYNLTEYYICAPVNRNKDMLSSKVIEWAKTYLMNENCYKTWHDKYRFFQKYNYGHPFSDFARL